MKRINFLMLLLLILGNVGFAQNNTMTAKEKNAVNLFHDFIHYLNAGIKDHDDIGDSSHLEFILSHYVFVNQHDKKPNETAGGIGAITKDQLRNVRKEVNAFVSFLEQHAYDSLSDNLVLKPLRLSTDKSVYDKLTSFQKKNTFIYFNRHTSKKVFGYILFIPPLKGHVSETRIWSWTLMFEFGKYTFRSVDGKEGEEYIFQSKN